MTSLAVIPELEHEFVYEQIIPLSLSHFSNGYAAAHDYYVIQRCNIFNYQIDGEINRI